MDVRVNNNGTLLFQWYPKKNEIILIRKKMYYRIRLYRDRYLILDAKPKSTIKHN